MVSVAGRCAKKISSAAGKRSGESALTGDRAVRPRPHGDPTSGPSMAVELQDLGKRFGDGAPVLDDVNATIGQGEFVALLGASGCGKSTLLNIMAGLETPTSGALEIPATAPPSCSRTRPCSRG